MNQIALPGQARGISHFALAAAAIGLAVLILYWPGTSGSFIFDDIPNITEQQAVHADAINQDTLSEAAGAYSSRFLRGRPLATITFAVDHARAGGLDAGAFKQTNLFIHAFNALLVLLLVSQLLKQAQTLRLNDTQSTAPAPGTRHLIVWAGTITLLWAIHPLQVSTVLYVVQRMEMLAVTFTLLALISYCHGRRRQIQGRQRGGALVAGALALAAIGLLAKETAVLFVLFAFSLELTLFGFGARKQHTALMIKASHGLILLAALAIYLLVVIPTFARPEAFQIRDFTWHERLLTQLRILPLYLSQILMPILDRMPFFYDDYTPSTSLFKPLSTFFGGLLLASLIALAVAVRRSAPLLTLAILWFFAAHALTSNIFNLELAFEHRNYFAVLPVLLGLACLLTWLPNIRVRFSPALIGILAIGLFATLTMIRAATWGDPLNLAMHHVAINPESERARLEIGFIYGSMSGGDTNSPFYAIAVSTFENASGLPRSSPMPEQALIVLAASADAEAEEDWWNSFVNKLESRPMGAQTRGAANAIVRARLYPLPIDDEWLAKTYETLAGRPETPPDLLMPFASYALRFPENSHLDPRTVLGEVRQRASQDQEQLDDWAAQLTAAGHPEAAQFLVGRRD
ncbi:hypothetical protein IC757_04690 [Wenzhouxiangella sp. AB-CW3]|uniref:hypothetical protein n=1 Tax=Wenzhouxiangella sp. AB-CW3 TaxID=2771012 RepID=UPI00168B3E49|nr:hypothetical protein [Wenzhouxiangella sp. AB-CW3]QOC23443.1 hypothetical protein IC757_04690 [Wenzhouxiangella sp. AB-CW3]